jgi:dethiobiotin synthetase
LTLAGWVINRVDPHMSRYEENLDTLKAMLPAPFLGELPFVDAVNEVDLHHCLDVSPLL